MNVSIETMSGLQRRLTIALPSEEFESQITARLREARAQVRLAGFRPGKVPLKEVRRRYGTTVRAEVAGEMMQSSFVTAVQQESLNPAGTPNLEVVKMDPGIDFEFTATFEVFPNIELGDLSKIAVRKPQAEVTVDDMATMISRLLEQRTTFEPVDRPVQEGDLVKADFSATFEGEPVDGTAGEDAEFRVGKGQMIEDFDQGVLGVNPGESVEFDATFPDDYRAEDLRGKTVQFSATVKEVKEPVLPELDEEFFQAFGVNEGGEEAFRSEVQKNMERELDSAINNQLKNQVMEQLAELHEFQLPHALIHREIHALKDQMLGQFQMGGPGSKPDLPDDLFSDEAEKRVKVGLLVNEIINAQSLEVEQDKLEKRLAELAAQYGEPEQVINFYKSNPDQLQSIEMGVLEEQVVEHILSAAAVEIVESSYEEVLSGSAILNPESQDDTETLEQQAGQNEEGEQGNQKDP